MEIDKLIDQGDRLIPVEVKSGKTFSSDFLKPLPDTDMKKGFRKKPEAL